MWRDCYTYTHTHTDTDTDTDTDTMNVLATTRFNSHTWNENKRWRETHGLKGCIYGTPSQLSHTIILESTVFILEMHNDENKIKGVGMIINIPNVNKYHNIYSNKNYNRYTYKSEYRIDRDDMTKKELTYIRVLDTLLFTTSRHLKRGYGITSVPKRIMENIHINFITFFKNMFSLRFNKNETENETETEKETEKENDIQYNKDTCIL